MKMKRFFTMAISVTILKESLCVLFHVGMADGLQNVMSCAEELYLPKLQLLPPADFHELLLQYII